nr:trypsin 3A1-like [Aedes albopictus]
MTLLHILITVLFSLVHISKGGSSRSSYIVGGLDIDITDVPYQVSLQTRNHSHFCGGSIISRSWVLTAAHCTENENITDYGVRVGTANYSSGGEFIPIKNIVPHPKYGTKRRDYDFSLLQLVKLIVLKSNSQIIALPRQNEVVMDNTPCIISGWGSIRDTDRKSSEILQASSVLVYNQRKCNSIHEEELTDRMICTSAEWFTDHFFVQTLICTETHGQRGTCSADSGGPVVANRKLIGVVSWGGTNCGDPEYPDVHARVSAVRDWIYNVTNI